MSEEVVMLPMAAVVFDASGRAGLREQPDQSQPCFFCDRDKCHVMDADGDCWHIGCLDGNESNPIKAWVRHHTDLEALVASLSAIGCEFETSELDSVDREQAERIGFSGAATVIFASGSFYFDARGGFVGHWNDRLPTDRAQPRLPKEST